MGKFDGILLVTDLDGTLLRDDKSISAENIRAIEYFESEGGLFSFVTGRPPIAMGPVLEQLRPKIPIGCLNGAGVCDMNTGDYIAKVPLSRDAMSLVNYAYERMPTVGFEFVTFDNSYLYLANEVIEELREFERLPDNYIKSFDEVKGELCKILFADREEHMEALMATLQANPESQKYNFVCSSKEYYELLPKEAHKGVCVRELVKYLGISPQKTVAVGDNSNDVLMLREAALGIAVLNASSDAKEAADVVLDVTNEQHAIANIISRLDDGTLSLE